MAPRKITVEEKKHAKRAREKARYGKNMSDPVKAMDIKNRMHANYMRRKEKQKAFSQKTDGEKRSLRKQWREKKRTYRLKKKENTQPEQNLEEQTDINAPLQIEESTSHPTEQESLNTPPEKKLHQFESGRKRRDQNKRRCSREYTMMKRQMDAKDVRIAELERKCDSLRKRLERQKQKNTNSPRSLVNMMKKDARLVKKKLALEGL